MGDFLPRRIAIDVSDVVPDHGGTAGLTSQWLTGAGGDKYVTQSAFLTNTCQVHPGHLG